TKGSHKKGAVRMQQAWRLFYVVQPQSQGVVAFSQVNNLSYRKSLLLLSTILQQQNNLIL
ncbi:MAG: hypothetical protein MR544_11365, partial [Parabacteroides sp.]|nr:hypothetical protein [Parabacteroides sp.]